jgi:hypothetical protein
MSFMADRAFETTLERLFAEEPEFRDGDLFVARVTQRLNRGWTFRQFLIGSLGLLGGLIGGGQMLASGLVSRLNIVTTASRHMLSSRLGEFTTARVLPGGLALNSEVVWMAGALAVVAIGLALTRGLRDI